MSGRKQPLGKGDKFLAAMGKSEASKPGASSRMEAPAGQSPSSAGKKQASSGLPPSREEVFPFLGQGPKSGKPESSKKQKGPARRDSSAAGRFSGSKASSVHSSDSRSRGRGSPSSIEAVRMPSLELSPADQAAEDDEAENQGAGSDCDSALDTDSMSTGMGKMVPINDVRFRHLVKKIMPPDNFFLWLVPYEEPFDLSADDLLGIARLVRGTVTSAWAPAPNLKRQNAWIYALEFTDPKWSREAGKQFLKLPALLDGKKMWFYRTLPMLTPEITNGEEKMVQKRKHGMPLYTCYRVIPQGAVKGKPLPPLLVQMDQYELIHFVENAKNETLYGGGHIPRKPVPERHSGHE